MNSHNPTDSAGIGHLEQTVTIFRKLPIFRETPADIVSLYAYLARHEKYQAGSVIFRQGHPSDRMFLVIEGTVSICEERGDKVLFMQEIHGDGVNYFGELALLARFKWFFTARALTEVHLISISREAFLKVQERFPGHFPQAVETIVQLRIDRFISQINSLIDRLPDDAWQDCPLPEPQP